MSAPRNLTQNANPRSALLSGDCPKHPYRLAGQCLDCRREEELRRRAEELVSRRTEERRRRIEKALEPYRNDIARDLSAVKERHAAEYFESMRLQCENEASAPYIERVAREVGAAMLADALQELQARGES